jgi:LysM repeat protein
MQKDFRQVALIVVMCVMIVGVPSITPRSASAQPASPNLLADGGFEALPPWPLQGGAGDVYVAPGWQAYYLESPPAYVPVPSNCPDTPKRPACYWMRPRFSNVDSAAFANRVHGGLRAQKYYSDGRMHEAGLMQRVTGIKPGTALRFSIFIQAWQCFNANACGANGIRSDQPANMHLRVGIDPAGGTNPFSPDVVWSDEQVAFDRWVEFAVQATAKSDAVTVFTHSRAEWDFARQNNEVYLDDASLVVASGPGAAAPPSAGQAAATTPVAGTPAPNSLPAATPTPRPDGAVVYVVKAGDTLYNIALQYKVSVDDLYKLNNLTPASVLSIGHEIVVQVGKGGAPVAQPTPAPKTTQSLAPQTPVTPTVPTATATSIPPTATSSPGGLCLSAFDDVNGNGVRDGNESGLAGVTFAVSSGGGQVTRYSTDAAGKPYCLTTLPPGAYSVQVTLPPGYVAASEKVDISLTLGQRVDLAIAARRGEKATPTAQAKPPSAAPSRASTTLIVVVAVVVVLLVLTIVALVVVRRRP